MTGLANVTTNGSKACSPAYLGLMSNGQLQPKAKKSGRNVPKVDPPPQNTDRFPSAPGRADWGVLPANSIYLIIIIFVP